jgi:hypothetical protein
MAGCGEKPFVDKVIENVETEGTSLCWMSEVLTFRKQVVETELL